MHECLYVCLSACVCVCMLYLFVRCICMNLSIYSCVSVCIYLYIIYLPMYHCMYLIIGLPTGLGIYLPINLSPSSLRLILST